MYLRLSFGLLAACCLMFAAAPGADWSVYGGGPGSIRYSSLRQINRENVRRLQVAWTFDSHDEFAGSEMQCNPIVVKGILYATTPRMRVIALDAATGRLRWSFNPNPEKTSAKFRNRGVTFWSTPDGKDSRIVFAFGHDLYALDALRGTLIDSFGEHGRIDLRRDLGRDPELQSISATSPAIVYKDLLILGSIVSESLPASPGDIRAYDARSGKLRWTFHTIPHPGEFGYDTWPKDAWTYSGGVNNWAGMSLDEKRGIVYVPLGSASFDFYGGNRPGDNLFANCLLALNAATGERLWHFQTVRHDLWDRDLPSPPSLVRLMRHGHPVDAVAQITKSGFVYVFNRETGESLFPIEDAPYPASDVDGESTSRTQPLPAMPPPFARQQLTEAILTQRTPAAHEAVLQRFRLLRSAGQFIPPSLAGTVVFPGFDGGGEWGGAAFDPQTSLLYVNSNEMAWILRLVEKKKLAPNATGADLYQQDCASCHRSDRKGTPPEFPSLLDIGARLSEQQVDSIIRNGRGRMPAFASFPAARTLAIARFVVHGEGGGAAVEDKDALSPLSLKYGIDGYNKFLDPEGYPAVEPPWGALTAIDLSAGKIAWAKPLGEFPELADKSTGSENYGGPVVTAGGLLFIGATVHDRKFRAFDKSNGKLLWETVLPAGGNATPAVYRIGRREFVVIACGGGKSGAPSGGKYVAFALPN